MSYQPGFFHSLENLLIMFIYSEKATQFCEISALILSYVVPVKSRVKISQNFVAFSAYMNLKLFHFVALRSEDQGKYTYALLVFLV